MPEAARELAARLATPFGGGHELVLAINTASRLLEANDRLTACLSANALRNVYGPKGRPRPLRPPTARPEDEQPIAAVEDVADTIRHAFTEVKASPSSAARSASTSARPTPA